MGDVSAQSNADCKEDGAYFRKVLSLLASRYIRLLFTREMPFNSAMRIWDGLFAADGRLDELVQYVCVAMLLRIRHLCEHSVWPSLECIESD